MTRTPPVAPALALLVAVAAGCSAHLHRHDEPTLDFEPLWMGIPIARDHLFEAQLPHHVDFYNGLDEPRALDDGGFSTTLSFSFIVHARVMTRVDPTSSKESRVPAMNQVGSPPPPPD